MQSTLARSRAAVKYSSGDSDPIRFTTAKRALVHAARATQRSLFAVPPATLVQFCRA